MSALRVLPPVPEPRAHQASRASVPSSSSPSTTLRPSAMDTQSRAPEVDGRSFTARGVAVGLLVGLAVCFSNMYFGLQTGWVSIMSMPTSLMGFGFFKLLSGHLRLPLTPVENVLVQSVAGGMAIMPLGCGFVGVLPAMNYLLTPDERGPIVLSLGKMILWSLGLCYFGVVFAVPLRRQVIIRERLKFPSGFSTAVLISVLHGRADAVQDSALRGRGAVASGFASLAGRAKSGNFAVSTDHSGQGGRQTPPPSPFTAAQAGEECPPPSAATASSWQKNIQLLLVSFAVSGLLTVATYFLPFLRDLPVFGSTAAATWLWSLAYVGQGIIMGPTTTLHMLLGAVIGWAVLSPLAKARGWAPGETKDWADGSKGWIIWISLAIMLADAVVSLGHLALRPVWRRIIAQPRVREFWEKNSAVRFLRQGRPPTGYTSVGDGDEDSGSQSGIGGARPSGPITAAPSLHARAHKDRYKKTNHDGEDGDGADADAGQVQIPDDAPDDQQISDRAVMIGLALSIAFCIFCIHVVFGDLVPLYATIMAVLMALVLSIMGVRALGETDLNPVSGISKLAQLFFAPIIPQSNKSSVLINLVAGAVSEAGALQAGDLMQDLKTGHLLGAAPKAQFWGQVIGATAGAVVSALIYQLYTTVYTIPSELYQVPTAYVWIFTARLVTGQGLPPLAKEWAIGSAILFAGLTAVRISAANERWQALIPGGIAVAVGMYNTPSFTLARTVGGLLALWWRSFMRWQETPLIVLASGFILGEGVLSIVNLFMQSAGVPHL